MRYRLSYIIPICIYIVIVHILYLSFYDITFENSYNGLLLIYNFNLSKYVFSVFTSFYLVSITYKQLLKNELTSIVLALLYLLYFVPGIVQQAILNESWLYIICNFLFLILLDLWSKLLKPFKIFTVKQITRVNRPNRYINLLILISIISIPFLLTLSNTTFSTTTLIETFMDVYGVRAEAKANQMHWIIINIEYCVAYFIIFIVPYTIKHKRWLVLLILIICELSIFLIQANRVFVFLLIISVFISFCNIDNKKLTNCFALLGISLLIETLLIEEGLVFTDIFRRFTIVPNRINGFYFDYFLENRPDFLSSHYDRIFTALGVESYYENNPIGVVIGEKYFGWTINCNTGMLGGNMFNWGILAIIISSFGYILSFRIFEMFISNLSSLKYVLAIILVTLSINSSAMLANIFSISYFSLFLLLLFPMLKSRPI